MYCIYIKVLNVIFIDKKLCSCFKVLSFLVIIKEREVWEEREFGLIN